MNLENYAIFEPRAGSPAQKAIDELLADLRKNNDTRFAYAESLGAKGTWGNDAAVAGLVFAADATIPVGLKLAQKHEDGDVYQPDRRTPEGKEFAKKLRELPRLPGSSALGSRLGMPFIVRERYMLNVAHLMIGQRHFIAVPLDPEKGNAPIKVPEECDLVLLSAYYAAKEAHDAASAEKETAS